MRSLRTGLRPNGRVQVRFNAYPPAQSAPMRESDSLGRERREMLEVLVERDHTGDSTNGFCDKPRSGDSVRIDYRESTDSAQSLVAGIEREGGGAIEIDADVAQNDAVVGMFNGAAQAFGPADMVVNNASIAITRNIDDLTEADFDRTIEVNLSRPFCAYRPRYPRCGANNATHRQYSVRRSAWCGLDWPAGWVRYVGRTPFHHDGIS
jgi:hypothetical protein